MGVLAEIAKRMKDSGISPASFDSEDWEGKRVEWENATPGTLTGVDCPVCLNKGYIRRMGEDGVAYSVECECMAKRRSLRRIEQSGLGDLLDRYTFDAYQTPDAWQKAAKQLALDYVESHDGKWFVASGTVGAGKSHLCTAICGALMDRGCNTRYMLWRDESVKLKAAVNDEAEYAKLMKPLKRVKVLYIDDFLKAGKDRTTGHAKVTEGDINAAFELLNARYNRRDLVTVISTELSMQQIMDIDAGLGSRIYERSKGFLLQIEGQNKNWRLKGN